MLDEIITRILEDNHTGRLGKVFKTKNNRYFRKHFISKVPFSILLIKVINKHDWRGRYKSRILSGK